MVNPMEASVCLKPVVVNTGSGGQDGLLVFFAKQLVAVLVLLEDKNAPDTTLRGQWFLEAGFGPCQAWNKGQIFATRDEAVAWIRDQVLKDGDDIP
ncbi:hypothetical protein [Methylobacterium isbiliense]|jgi:hypothetical protein|uniref:Uncharacterized protein n=1 Tax=Methylobacterium isbiliense TaxID=315478 RepID=A0ABQ4S9U5_9HYPH|nr:hypothetical protein [Methylobacterium isbiliense]MDN3622721.1 hypothetical protein [Methylobacterium isbiliense]GJD99881.1 hypothetical protein GMJLKIPL_1799 [Methylobacterium isbiliense]